MDDRELGIYVGVVGDGPGMDQVTVDGEVLHYAVLADEVNGIAYAYPGEARMGPTGEQNLVCHRGVVRVKPSSRFFGWKPEP